MDNSISATLNIIRNAKETHTDSGCKWNLWNSNKAVFVQVEMYVLMHFHGKGIKDIFLQKLRHTHIMF